MANQLANNMSSDDKEAMENMDMEKMISHVTQNVFKMMNSSDSTIGGGGPDIMNIMSGMLGKMSSPEPEIILQKTCDICFDLNIDLEDFYTGKKKKINVRRKRIVEENGKQTVVEEKKKIIIPIERGMREDQQIRFEGEADQIPGYSPGDIIITLIENEHPIFQRDNDNLIIIKDINLYELYDVTFDIKHLDSRVLRINKDNYESLHLNDSLRKISGQGMPIFKNDNKFGDLFIKFNLVIPKTIEPSKLEIFKKIFESTDKLSDTFSKQYILENISETELEAMCTDYYDSSDSDSSDSDDSDDSGSNDFGSISSSSDDDVKFVQNKSLKRK